MSAPLDPPSEQVMHLANYLARQLSRGIDDDLTGETGRLISQGATPAEIALARQYAGLAVDLRDALREAEPGTRLEDLPEYAALGSVPQVGMLRVYSGLGDLQQALGAAGTEYREDPFVGGPFFSVEFATEMVEQEEAEGFGPSADSDYVGTVVGDVLPFNLYSG
jgi:hypothetical protein